MNDDIKNMQTALDELADLVVRMQYIVLDIKTAAEAPAQAAAPAELPSNVLVLKRQKHFKQELENEPN